MGTWKLVGVWKVEGDGATRRNTMEIERCSRTERITSLFHVREREGCMNLFRHDRERWMKLSRSSWRRETREGV